MDLTQVSKAVADQARVRISERNDYHKGVEGIAVGFSPTYGNIKVGFLDENGEYSGDYTAVRYEHVELIDEAPIEARETTIRVAGVERVIRTEMGGSIRSVKTLESAHTKAVKAAIVEMRRANLNAYRLTLSTLEAAPQSPARDRGIEATKRIIRRAERGDLQSHGTRVSASPFPKVKYTTEIPGYLVEVEPGHYVTNLV